VTQKYKNVKENMGLNKRCCSFSLMPKCLAIRLSLLLKTDVAYWSAETLHAKL